MLLSLLCSRLSVCCVVCVNQSLFGFPKYHTAVAGPVKYLPTINGAFDGCAPYPDQSGLGKTDPVQIFLIQRGNCTFARKALNAQNANADAIIVINDSDGPLPYMAAGPEGRSLNTPGMIITKTDGDALIKQINDVRPKNLTWVSMQWFLPNPDDRVEWQFYTEVNDTNVNTHKQGSRQQHAEYALVI